MYSATNASWAETAVATSSHEQSSLPKEIQILSTLRKLDSLLVDRQLALERMIMML